MPYTQHYTAAYPEGIPQADSGSGDDSALSVAYGIDLAEAGSGSEVEQAAAQLATADVCSAADQATISVTLATADAGTADDPLSFSQTLELDEAGSGDDSQFAVGPGFADTGAAADAIVTGPVITDAGTADDSAFSVAATAELDETGTADDQPWEYAAIGAAAFPYYAEIPAAALGRVQVGDEFVWYAAG